MLAKSEDILDFVKKKEYEAHADTWKHFGGEFKNGTPTSCEWRLAKERELLCGDILRFIKGC